MHRSPGEEMTNKLALVKAQRLPKIPGGSHALAFLSPQTHSWSTGLAQHQSGPRRDTAVAPGPPLQALVPLLDQEYSPVTPSVLRDPAPHLWLGHPA